MRLKYYDAKNAPDKACPSRDGLLRQIEEDFVAARDRGDRAECRRLDERHKIVVAAKTDEKAYAAYLEHMAVGNDPPAKGRRKRGKT